MAFKTTKQIIAQSVGFRRGAMQPIAPGELPPALWADLLADGSVVEVKPPAKPKAKTKRKPRAKKA